PPSLRAPSASMAEVTFMCYFVPHMRFDYNLLDPDDPFEIDEGNRPHLHKRLPRPNGRYVAIGPEDLLDVYTSNAALFYPADLTKGDAHWILVGHVPGLVLASPLAPPNSGDPRMCRPIGLSEAPLNLRIRYERDIR